MPSSERTIQINSLISAVFAFFADAENDPKWRQGVLEIKRQGPLGVGATYHQRVAGPGGRAVAADIEVTDYQVDARLAFRATAGPVRPIGVYTFRASGQGTELTFALSAELSGVKKLFMSGAVQKSMDSQMASLDTAKKTPGNL